MVKTNLVSKCGVALPLLALLVTTALACSLTTSPTPTPAPDYPLATVDALTTENARLANQVAGLATSDARQATQIASQERMIGYLATRVGALPPPTVAPLPTMTPYHPVYGSVEIEEGRCCVGGIAGETIQVDVAFEATSPRAEVTEMRTRAGGIHFTESEMAEAEWEPFVPLKTFPVYVAINWIGFYVSVQYRDAQGNLSPVYYDDISVEGHPPSPTP
jgi:hypothetical protein